MILLEFLMIREIVEGFYVKKKSYKKDKGTQIAVNVQNVYIDLENDAYVATNSLPNYFNEDLQLNYRDVVISDQVFLVQKLSQLVILGLYTGDSVFYDANFSEENTANLSGVLFCQRVDENNFKLAKSLSNVENEICETTGFIDFAKFLRTDNYAFNKQTQVEQIALTEKYQLKRKNQR